jgi:hypothetical protein
MNRLSSLLLAFAAVAFALAGSALTAQTQAQTNPGYLWLQAFSANNAGSDQLTLSGDFVNDCNGGLPPGAHLRIFFDQAILLNVQITAGFGQMQRFSRTVNVPNIPPPTNHVTAYRFTIILPPSVSDRSSIGPDMKTSPCLVTGVLGIPSE